MSARIQLQIQRHSAPAVQTKLAVNKPGDAYEQEADRVADQVMRMSAPFRRPASRGFTSRPNFVQRKCAQCEEEDEKLLQKKEAPGQQVAATGQSSSAPGMVSDVLRPGGQPLDPGTREFMESRFNHDFGQVRVHAGNRAAESARALNAVAYTVWPDVVFGAGQFSPDTGAGRRLLAHELNHVVQQTGAMDTAPFIQRQTTASPLFGLSQPSVLGISLPVKSVEFTEAEGVSAASPKIVELAGAYNAQGFGATIELSANFTEAAKLSSAKQKEESSQLIRRLHAVRDALTAAGVPASQVNLSPPTAYSTSAHGQVTVDLKKGSSGSGLFPSMTPSPVPQTPSPAAATPSKSLSDLLSFKFKAGSVEFAVDLPKSATAKLPVALRGGKALAFELKAETSGTFSFSVTLDGLPHVRVRLEAQASVSKEKGATGSAGLVIETTRTVCHAPSPDSLKAAITKAGDDLKKAMTEAQAAKTNEDKLSKLVDVASAIGDMYDAVDKAKSACKEEPAATFKFGVQGPLSTPSGAPEETDPSKRPGTYVGGSVTWYF